MERGGKRKRKIDFLFCFGNVFWFGEVFWYI